MNIVASSRSVTATVADDARTLAGTPCACMLHTTQAVNNTPAVAHAMRNRRRIFFQSIDEFGTVTMSS